MTNEGVLHGLPVISQGTYQQGMFSNTPQAFCSFAVVENTTFDFKSNLDKKHINILFQIRNN